MGLWCCLKLDPEDRFEENQERELSPYESPQGYASGMGGKPKGKGKGDKGKGVRDTVANSIVPGSGLACEERVAWVNALAFDLRKLARGEQGYFYCMWVGFNEEYYSKAAARKEYTNRFKCNFFMQLASDAFISSNPGLLYGGREADVGSNSPRTCKQFRRRNLNLRCASTAMEGWLFGPNPLQS